MKIIIHQDHPKLDNTLVQAAIEAWDSINKRILTNLCDSIPHKVQAILAADS